MGSCQDTSDSAEVWQSMPERVRKVWWVHAAMQSLCWSVGGIACMSVLDATGWWDTWRIWLKYAIVGVPLAVALFEHYGSAFADPIQVRV